ncbi:ubiquinol-cytochrome C reductase complex core protein-like protein 2 [Eremomyces bilateralis CBS 781.70]|uniref:Cytochrome b-c1 complex subunit 2, mitochondrial n=1 Tax=Eremomyces bilateralis CBS 781.70 TaxID=1392243 RepID=A0A6G1G972_9PEZI|nr:ubiquinol-cytochrome C reductase complex core protein-like protein 2 [Eremomyces bilateralis CBS 781.70]KAF1814451.1 ubiquinol-cytochrome C reductase complex core protein-like protein 2 [Eremomyces bilateralis CBS 781.70]
MLSSSTFGRRAALRAANCRQCLSQPANRRGLAAPASGSFQYESSEAAGVKIASRDFAGPTTTLALVAKAGTRFQTYPGVTEGLEKYAFRTTERRSALRIVREAELLGAELSSYHTRENLILGAKFLRQDLPYFLELFAEIVGSTKYEPHVYDEEIKPLIQMAHKRHIDNTTELAINSAHSLAFHRGLGVPLRPSSATPYTKYVDANSIAEFASAAYSKSNFALVANGTNHGNMAKWAGQFFSSAKNSSAKALESPPSKYQGGEERIAHNSGNTMVLAFPGSSSFTGGSYKPEIQVLASLLGGQSSVKWSSGFSLLANAAAPFPSVKVATKSAIYSDAGLLYVTLEGSAKDVAGAAQETVKTIKAIAGGDIKKDDISKAIAQAKFKELEYGQQLWAGLELTGSGLVQSGKVYQIDETAKKLEAVTEEQVKKVSSVHISPMSKNDANRVMNVGCSDPP